MLMVGLKEFYEAVTDKRLPYATSTAVAAMRRWGVKFHAAGAEGGRKTRKVDPNDFDRARAAFLAEYVSPESAESAAPEESQLDRIERKLNLLLDGRRH